MNNVTTFDNFPPFATNGSRNMNTESAKYAVGFLEGETFPAEWANYLFHGATKGVSDLNTAVQSIWKENINVIQGSGQTPSSSDNTQLKTAIELMIQNAVLTANAQVLARAKLDAHPVGSLYWSSDPTDPSILFGGTWVQIKDRFIWAKGDSDTVNATGGSKTVSLAVSNLPSHSHSFTPEGTISGGSYSFTGTTGTVNVSGGNHNHSLNLNRGNGSNDYNYISCQFNHDGSYKVGTDPISNSGNLSMSGSFTPQGSVSVSSNPTFSGTRSATENSGSGQSFSIMNPYVVKYCWERVS